MNLFDRAITKIAEKRGIIASDMKPADFLAGVSGRSVLTAAGANVSEDTALRYSAVLACVRILAENVAQLPLLLYRRTGGRKERAPEHPLYGLLHNAPNDEMTSFQFRETVQGHIATWGNCYSEIAFDETGHVTAIYPLRPDRMRAERVEGRLVYRYRRTTPNARGNYEDWLPAGMVLHVPGLGFDGIMGYSPIAMARQAIGLGLATEAYGARFFGNDSRPGGVLKHPKSLTDNAAKRLKESWEAAHLGDNQHRVAVIEEGMEWQSIGVPPEDSQFLETRKFQIQEIARIYRIPPHMLADLDRATFSNIEHQSLSFVVQTLLPWLRRWEQALTVKLLTPSERQQYFIEFLVDGLLRGDMQSRYMAYATARQWGWMSANDIRNLENMNPVEGGDAYLVPLNMIPADQAGAGMMSTDSGQDVSQRGQPQGLPLQDGRGRGPADYEERAVRSATERHRLQRAHIAIYQDIAARVYRRERNDVMAAARKMLAPPGIGQSSRGESRGMADFRLWLEEFYRGHGRWVFDQFAPTAHAYGELVAAAAQDEIGEPQEMTAEIAEYIHMYLATFTARHCQISQARIIEILMSNEVDPLAALEAELESWPEKEARSEAQWESVGFGNALTHTIYVAAGILKMRWRASGKTCAYCSALDGKVVGIQEPFLGAGQAFQPDGAQGALTPRHNVKHPPSHQGCDCLITAER